MRWFALLEETILYGNVFSAYVKNLMVNVEYFTVVGTKHSLKRFDCFAYRL